MSSNRLQRHGQGERGNVPRGRKVRTSDCRRCIILNGLRDAGVPFSVTKAICDRMWLNRVRRKQCLHVEGNGATHLYAIRRGKVKLLKYDGMGRQRVLDILESGDMFGFEAIFEERYTTTAESLADGELCLASADQLRQLVREQPRIGIDLARYLHVRVTRSMQRQLAVTATGALAKLAGFLLHRLDAQPGGNGDAATVPRHFTLEELSGVLGVTPETVCRALAEMRSLGIVERKTTGIHVRDVNGLRAISGL